MNFDNQTNTLHYQIHETLKHNGTYWKFWIFSKEI